MIGSNAFNYINVLDKAADASWKRKDLISNNIANADTPGYKRKDLNFESVLNQELSDMKYQTLDSKIDNADLSHLDPRTYTDYANYSYRKDKNNVDMETEQVELASEQIKYQALTTSISSEFERMKTVLK